MSSSSFQRPDVVFASVGPKVSAGVADSRGEVVGQCSDVGRRLGRGSGIEWRLGVVRDHELEGLGCLGPLESGHHGQGEVDPGGNPGTGHDLALEHHPLRGGLGAVATERLVGPPMSCGLEPVEQPRRAQQQRSRADRGRVGGVFVDGPDPVDHRAVVVGDAPRGAATGDQNDVGLCDLVEGVVDVEVQLPVLVVEPATAGGAHDRLCVGMLRQHLVGADGVENGEARI
jgi:hypothetical protein